jgi:hypothetical protein
MKFRATQSAPANVDGARVAYRLHGRGPAVVLVNGTAALDAHWGPVIAEFSKHRTVISLDYSGSGETTDGRPSQPQDLQDFRCILLRQSARLLDRWQFSVDGQDVTVGIEGPLIIDDVEACIRATLRGVGLFRLPTTLSVGNWRPCWIQIASRSQGFRFTIQAEAQLFRSFAHSSSPR